ncbi:MAG: (Fe-S)-binding protein [Desulfuromonadales bacterium]|nr:(Fe-S)-binding protein [Desulfuromonadales bacterium]
MEITRALGTYSQMYWLLYLLASIAVVVCAIGVKRQVRRWRLGQGKLRDRLDHPLQRILAVVVDILTQRRFRRAQHPWHFHAFLVWGFALFFLATLCVMLQEHFGLPTFSGVWYLGLKLALDLFALLVLAGVSIAAWRRWRTQPVELSRPAGSALPLVLIALLPLSGLLLEGVRLAREDDLWALSSPVGFGLASFFSGLEPQSYSTLHQGLWWGHLSIALVFIAIIPFTRLFHLASGSAALFLVDRQGAAALVPLDFSDEDATSYGVGTIKDFHWKRLLDTDACTGCGRCQTQCPAWLTKKPLSPKELGEALSTQLSNESPEPIAGTVVKDETLWACTTCRACEVQCPIAIEHVPRLVDLRRHLVLTESRFPTELQTAFRGVESSGNPWSLPRQGRGDWAQGLDIPLLADAPDSEVLFWPGCAAAYDHRARRTAQAQALLFHQAGINFAILGAQESCCGDAARRTGNEYLFQSLATKNIATLAPYPVKTIVTGCPHCFNTLQNEYPAFGGQWEVVHHTTFLQRLVQEGRLPVIAPLSPAVIVYHDSCYLARYHSMTSEPRFLLTQALGQSPVEVPRCGDETFCCGGGGGRFWLEERTGDTMRGERFREFKACGAQVIATACPICLTMLADGLKEDGGEGNIRIHDVAELLADACLPGGFIDIERRPS